MFTPVETLVMLSGQSAVLNTPAVGDARDYDPAATSDFAPSGGTPVTLSGIWSDSYEDGLQSGEVGVFLIAASSLPGKLQAMKSTLVLNGKTYKVSRVRTRVYLGAIDGYNLFLAA
jgi:hypothetical protein